MIPIDADIEKLSTASSKHQCRVRTRMAVERGLLVKPPACERCGQETTKLDCHHPDYTKPLLIRWLCKTCHAVEDKTRRMDYPPEFMAETNKIVPYLLRNDDVQHQERLALEKWYAKKHGRVVTYKEILHGLQREKVAAVFSRHGPLLAEEGESGLQAI